MFKRLIEWIKSLFKKPTTNSTPAPASPVVNPPDIQPHSTIFAIYKARGETWMDVLRIRQQQGLSATLTDAELQAAIQAGYDLAPKVPVQSERDLSTHLADTAVHGPWFLQDGQQMTLTGVGRVRIWGAAGTQLRSVNGVEVSGTTGWIDADLPFTFSVVSTGGNIAAQRVA